MARIAHHTGAHRQALPDGGLARPVRMPTAVEIFWATRIFGQETAAQRGPQPSIRGATVGPPWPPSTPPVWGARAGRPTGSSTAVDTPLPSPELGRCRLPPFPPLRGGAQRTRHLPMGCRCRGPAGGAMAAACTEMAYTGLRTLSWMERVTLWRSRGRNPKEAGRVSLGGQIGSLPPLILGTRRGPPPHGRQRPLHGRRRAASAGRVWAFGWRGFRLPSREGDESPSPPPRPPLGQAPLPACNAASSRSPLRVRHESFPPRASFLARSTVLYIFFYRVHLHTGHTPRCTTEGPLTPFVQAVPFCKAPARGTGRLLGCGARPHSLPASRGRRCHVETIAEHAFLRPTVAAACAVDFLLDMIRAPCPWIFSRQGDSEEQHRHRSMFF